jgi:hypothetical protein
MGGRRVSKAIKKLHTAGILERREPRSLTSAYEYRFTEQFRNQPCWNQWIDLSETLFSELLPWQPLFNRPVVGHGFLNASGVLVFGAILAARTGVSTGALQIYLRGLVGEQTVRQAVWKLEAMAAVARNASGLLVATDDWRDRLSEFEQATGANSRARKLKKTVRAERLYFFGE